MIVKGPITIRLVAAPNPDLGETALGIKPEIVQVGHLAEASLVLREWVAKHGLGGGNMGRHCGEVRAQGELIARVSYNGRMWTPEPWPNCTEIVQGVFEPADADAHPNTKAIHARYALNPEKL